MKNKQTLLGVTVIILLLLVTYLLIYQSIENKRSANSSVLKSITVDMKNKIVFYEKHNPEFLFVQKISGDKTVWQQKLGHDSKLTRSSIEMPVYFMNITKQYVLFPLTHEDEDYVLSRKQTCLDYQSGEIVWQTDIPVGLRQKYFYSAADNTRIFIHNLNQIKGPLLSSLSLKTGKIQWQINCIYTPASPIQSDNYLILHQSNFQKALIINKVNGMSREIEINSQGFLYQKQYVYLKKAAAGYTVFSYNMKSNQATELIKIPEPITISSKNRLAAAIYKDQLIYQYLNKDKSESENHYFLKAVSLTDGLDIWTLALPENLSISLESRGDYFLYNYNILLCNPQYFSFYQIKNRYLPLFLFNKNTEKNSPKYRLIIVDLDKATIHKQADFQSAISHSFYSSDRIFSKYGHFFLDLYQDPNSSKSALKRVIVTLDGSTGDFVTGYSYDFIDKDSQRDYREFSDSLIFMSENALVWNIDKHKLSRVLQNYGFNNE